MKNLKKFHQRRVIKYLNQVLPILLSCGFDKQTLVIRVQPKDLLFILSFFKNHSSLQYKVLTAISGVDFPCRKKRFEVVYDLLSVRFNSLRIKTFVDEITPLISSFLFSAVQRGGNVKFGIFLEFSLKKTMK